MNYNCGIYQIRNLVNNKIYIGSSIDLYNRKAVHFSYLGSNQHHSIYFQRAYNKYGIEPFIFEVLIYCDEENCLLFEQRFLDYYWNKGILYNINPTAGNSLGIKHTDETKLKISESNKGKLIGNAHALGNKFFLTDEQKQKDRNAHLGKKHTEKSKLKMSISQTNRWNKIKS